MVHTGVFAVGTNYSEWNISRGHHYWIISIFFLCYRFKYGCANISLRFSRGMLNLYTFCCCCRIWSQNFVFGIVAGNSIRSVISYQLGWKNVLRKNENGRQSTNNNTQRRIGSNSICVLGQNGHLDAEHYDLQ